MATITDAMFPVLYLISGCDCSTSNRITVSEVGVDNKPGSPAHHDNQYQPRQVYPEGSEKVRKLITLNILSNTADIFHSYIHVTSIGVKPEI